MPSNDKLTPLSIRYLAKWILEDLKKDHVFGIPKELFFIPSEKDPFRMNRYGQILETPIGVAAGPHTQLSQNIIAAWLCGARYLELKTVQTLDELEISKPCIDMQDEGYNCEWSQELKLQQSLDEYLNAWIMIHILRDVFSLSTDQGPGMIFNMSVGYNLEGILKANVQDFMDRMENSREQLDNKLDVLSDIYPRIRMLDIPARMTDNITLSTMHGCPPDEIERIAMYLLQDRKLHTAVKLNPTLLGADTLRRILHEDLGYDDVVVPDQAFEHDLKYSDALELIRNLQTVADSSGVAFGLKLTNTLEVENHRSFFPEKENMMYLSGRALHPISINLAAKLQTEFKGSLDISFSAGADAFNVADTLACNLRPVTTCTDVLKPGGYTRLGQYITNIRSEMEASKASSLNDYILQRAGTKDSLPLAGLDNLQAYATTVTSNRAYHKHGHHFDSIKTARTLDSFDCIHAPCVDSCAAGQEIPDYLYHTSQGDFARAYEVIRRTNPLPGITGHVCDHLCQLKCTRNNYDNPLLIREIKRFVTEHEAGKSTGQILETLPLRVAVIGGGPAGLSCAYFLAREGVAVEVFEAKSLIGGMVSDAIPDFRLKDETIQFDLETLRSLGVHFHMEHTIDAHEFNRLKTTHDFIFIGIGAQKALPLGIPGESLDSVLDPLKFLSGVRQGDRPRLGERIAVIGGGNTAMDAARTALRLAGKNAEVTILYRRTRKEMPADIDEVEAALAEGITFQELTAPSEFLGEKNRLYGIRCIRMELGEPDASGRRRPVEISGSEFELPFDTVIPAIGQAVAIDFLSVTDLQVNPETNQTSDSTIYAGGDAVRGASSVINAIGDGQRAARHILASVSVSQATSSDRTPRHLEMKDYRIKGAIREFGIEPPLAASKHGEEFPLVHRTLSEEEAIKEAGRCLLCDDVCNVCVGVCPNMANLSYDVEPREYRVQSIRLQDGKIIVENADVFAITQGHQIINIGDFCNECGNCSTFCPTSGDPYKDKPRFYLSEKSYLEADWGYFRKEDSLRFKDGDNESILRKTGNDYFFESNAFSATLDGQHLEVVNVNLNDEHISANTRTAIEMVFLFEHLKNNPIFN